MPVKQITVILLCLQSTILFAQQPAYFILGENQFKGLKVFDIIQDNEQNYYFATNEGIIKYDFIAYTKLEVQAAKSISFFNLVANSNGVIFFNNLNNQIFTIKNGKCSLFYELNEKQSSTLIHLTTDSKGNLIIACKGVVVLDSNANVVIEKYSNMAFNSSFHPDKNSCILTASNDTVFYYHHNKLETRKLLFEQKEKDLLNLLYFFEYNKKSYCLDLISKSLFVFNINNWTLTKVSHNNFFNSATNARTFVTQNKIWSPSSVSGINYSENGFEKNYKTFYLDYFISDVYEDKEGNILLGTFDKGIMVVPNLQIPDVINPFAMNPMTGIYADGDNTVYMGSNKGTFYVYTNRQTTDIAFGKKPLEGIYGSPKSQYLIFDNEKILCYNKNTKKGFSFTGGSLKDVAFISQNQMYLGTNMGIAKLHINGYMQYRLEQLPEHHFRIYSLAYNDSNQTLYSSGANGMYAIKHNGDSRKIQHNGKDLFPEKIVCHNGEVFAAMRNEGILRINKNNSINSIKPKLPNKDEYIKSLAVYQNTIIISTSYGLYQLNFNGDILNQYHTLYGFDSKKVYQFSVAENTLWVSHLGGVQKIDLLLNHIERKPPEVLFREIKVNNNIVSFHAKHSFNASQRKFDFVVYAATLRHLSNTKYHYRLLGYEENWQTLASNNHVITYNALSPGNYTLVVKAESYGQFGPEKSYSFSISKPVYTQAWFVASAVFVFLLLVYWVYRRQLNIQKQKSKQVNELNLSKLTAIQSQMNPHFIFNSLNSIQDLVLQQNATKAYDSIGKFALLIRKIMHHSEKEFIDIEEELSMLHVYLEMELLRIKKDFTYTINSNGLSDIEIPPMLIQPYIENAFKHGLLHQTGPKRLEIEMYIKNNAFVCEITDNGVGRKKSQEMKDRQKRLYESFSGQSLTKRLEILKKHFGGDFGVEIIDLYNSDNLAIGTKVILKAPYKQKF